MKLTLILVLCALILAPVLLLASDESLTITTYYPSPSGSYNELSTNMLNVGITASPANNSRDGIANFKPRGTPTVTNQAGDLYYNSTNGFQYNNGSGWQNFGGGNQPDYDSGWFQINRCCISYTKPHGLGSIPMRVVVLQGVCNANCPDNTTLVSDSPGGMNGEGGIGPSWSQDATSIIVQAGYLGAGGCSIYSAGYCAAVVGNCNVEWPTNGYYRILAWKQY